MYFSDIYIYNTEILFNLNLKFFLYLLGLYGLYY